GDDACGCDPADLGNQLEEGGLGEPEVAIGTRDDAVGIESGKVELAQDTRCRDPADLFGNLCKPEGAVGTGCDATRLKAVRERKLGDDLTAGAEAREDQSQSQDREACTAPENLLDELRRFRHLILPR